MILRPAMNHLGTAEPSMATCSAPRDALRALAGAAGVATVLALLSGSASALAEREPARCPLRFNQPTIGLPRTCLFVGRLNTKNGGQMLAVFAGDGSIFVVALARSDATPLLFLPAATLSPTVGRVLRPQDGAQGAVADGQAVSEQVGEVRLEDDGRRLRIRAAARPGNDGSPAEFIGHFATMVDAGQDPVASPR